MTDTRSQILMGMTRAFRNDTVPDEAAARAMVAAAQQLFGNATDNSNWRSYAASISGGYPFDDTMHNIYLDYGYPQSLQFYQLWNMYRRFGIARNVVELPIEYGWIDTPEIMNGAIAPSIEQLDKRISFWKRLKGLDTRQRVGRYAGVFMRVRDGKKPREPIDGTLGGEGALMQMIPLYEGQLKVLETDNNPLSERFGLPTMYQYNGGSVGNRSEKSAQSFSIHPDRIVIAAEGADDGSIYGIPVLEPIYNSLMDLRKIIGGGAEGFYKNAAQSVVFGIKDTAGAKAVSDLLTDFTDAYDTWHYNRTRRAMLAPGMEPTVLASNLVSSEPHYKAALNDVAAGSKIPATILIGQQTGRLASDQDNTHMLSMANSRRENFQTELVVGVLQWLQQYAIVPRGDIELEWSDLLATSDEEKLANAERMAAINHKQYAAGGEIPFDGNEIREAAGYEPAVLEEPGGEEMEEDDAEQSSNEI